MALRIVAWNISKSAIKLPLQCGTVLPKSKEFAQTGTQVPTIEFPLFIEHYRLEQFYRRALLTL